ncbi:MAG: UbiA family prenyltransferase [Candidatus Goldbacteria bacterium]|nr:UbiA family prenyltransferase [Candidatus Goldiibacteriota bacterium]
MINLNLEIFVLISGIIILSFIFFFINKPFLLFNQSRPSRFIYYSIIWICGFFLGKENFDNLSRNFIYINFFSGLLLINILFLSSTILNNIYDKNIDKINNKPNPLKEIINKKNYIKIFWICFISSLLISFSLNYTTLLITIIIHLVSYIYSSPPFRIKKIFPVNIILIAFSSVLALFLGFASSNEFKILFYFPYRLGLTMLIVLSLAFNVKDINDYAGDKKYGIKTIMTIFGFEKGKKIIAILAFLGYIFLPLFLNLKILLLYSFVFGILTSYTILRSKNKVNEPIIFLLFFIYLFIFILNRPLLF